MKKIIIAVLLVGVVAIASENVTYTFSGQSSTFDGSTNWVQVPLNAGGVDFMMTVSSAGGNLKALTDDFGIAGVSGTNDQLDGTDEIITLSFSKAINVVSIDLSGIGSESSDGANLTVGNESVVSLFTGSPSFNGTFDSYTPEPPIQVDIGDSIVLTGSAVSSIYELESITVSVVPEPAALSMLGLGGLLILFVRRFYHK